MLHLQRPQANIANPTKGKSQLEPDIPTIPRRANVLPNRPDEPHLCHTHDRAKDAEAEGDNGGDPGRKFGGLIVDLGVVAEVASLEEEMFAKSDSFVNGEPIALFVDVIILNR